jgi:hypothetical protein
LHLAYQCNLRPSRAQHRALERILEAQRLLYNAALQERIAVKQPRWEPYAGNPHVRICAGGVQ